MITAASINHCYQSFEYPRIRKTGLKNYETNAEQGIPLLFDLFYSIYLL